MSYNIDSVTIVSGELRIDPLKLYEARKVVHALADRMGAVPECAWIDQHTDCDKPIDADWHGEWSGSTLPAWIKSLEYTTGTAEIVLCWEGGDSFTGYIVDNGIVTKGELVQRVVAKP